MRSKRAIEAEKRLKKYEKEFQQAEKKYLKLKMRFEDYLEYCCENFQPHP